MDIVVGISGATGGIYALRLLEELKKRDITTHVIMSHWAKVNLTTEHNENPQRIKELADFYYNDNDLGALISSGSFLHDGMVIVPLSMKTLSAIAHGYTESLIARAADVTLKEGRKLVISPRETPLNQIHLENMLTLSRMNVRIVPPMPSFYNHPKTIDDIVNHHVMRLLDQLGIPNDVGNRYEGLPRGKK